MNTTTRFFHTLPCIVFQSSIDIRILSEDLTTCTISGECSELPKTTVDTVSPRRICFALFIVEHFMQCTLVKQSFIQTDLERDLLAFADRSKAFETCVTLGKCKDPGVDPHEGCKRALQTDACNMDPKCEQAEICDTNCFACYFIAKT